MRSRPCALFFPMVVVALAQAAHAEAPAPEPARIAFHGFVDGSLFAPISGCAAGSRGVILGVDQVELDVLANLLADVAIRMDLNWFPTSDAVSFDALVEQARVDIGLGAGWFLRFGKLNAPLGIELQDPVDMFQFSYSPLFFYAQPSNLTGLFAGWSGKGLEAQLFATNDWDQPGTPAALSLGGRVQVSSDTRTIGLTALVGPLRDEGRRLLLDLDLSLVVGDLRVWVEALLGRQRVGEGDATTWGLTVKGNYAFGAHSLTLRASWLDAEAGLAGQPELGRRNGELTLAWLFPIASGVAGVAELRADDYEVGDPVLTGALELTASF